MSYRFNQLPFWEPHYFKRVHRRADIGQHGVEKSSRVHLSGRVLMSQVKCILTITASLALSASFAFALALFLLEPAAAQASGDDVIYLDQGWSQADRQWYYQVSQGSEVMSYDIFLNLESAGSQELFRSDANSDRYGLTTQPANPQNPDALPIGLSKTVETEGRWKGEHIGLTCAACHNTQLNYQGKKIRIDGASANKFDLMAYIYALDDALQATLTDTGKFDRLAARLGASTSD